MPEDHPLPTGAPTGPVRLIVLNYNGGAFISRCIERLLALDWPADQLEVVVIDNASVDGSADDIEARFPEVRLIRNARNTGFGANNLGLTDLDGVRYVGLVNSDGFVEPGWLRTLVDALDADPTLGAVCPKMVFAPRFVDVTIDSPTTVPGIGDARQLGVMITGIRVGGRDVWADVQLAEGGWGIEQSPSGPFRWTAGHAVVRVPVDDGLGSAPLASGPIEVELRLRADSPRQVTLAGADRSTTVEVDTTARWFPVVTGGVPYDVIQNAGSQVFVDGAGADRGFLERDTGQYDEPAEVFAWCGGSVLFRPDYVRETGAFEERFFLYYEDTDWSWRGRAQGWRYRYVPEAVMRHLHAASSGEGSAVFTHFVERNRLLMLVRNAPAGLTARQVVRYGLITASYARRDIVGPLTRRQRPNRTLVVRRLRSFAGFLRLTPAMIASRRALRARQQVPDAELARWLVPRDPAPSAPVETAPKPAVSVEAAS
jgi:GT2 family glycosyltransferase